MALVGEGLLDGLGQLVLPFAMLVGEAGAGENAAGGEEVVEAGQLRGGGVLRLGGGDLDWGGHGRMLIETIRYRPQAPESSGGKVVPPPPILACGGFFWGFA